MPHAEAFALLTLLKGLRDQSATTHAMADVDIVADGKAVADTKLLKWDHIGAVKPSMAQV